MIKTIEVMIMFFRDNTDSRAVFKIVKEHKTFTSLTEGFYACIFMMVMMMMTMMMMRMMI